MFWVRPKSKCIKVINKSEDFWNTVSKKPFNNKIYTLFLRCDIPDMIFFPKIYPCRIIGEYVNRGLGLSSRPKINIKLEHDLSVSQSRTEYYIENVEVEKIHGGAIGASNVFMQDINIEQYKNTIPLYFPSEGNININGLKINIDTTDNIIHNIVYMNASKSYIEDVSVSINAPNMQNDVINVRNAIIKNVRITRHIVNSGYVIRTPLYTNGYTLVENIYARSTTLAINNIISLVGTNNYKSSVKNIFIHALLKPSSIYLERAYASDITLYENIPCQGDRIILATTSSLLENCYLTSNSTLGIAKLSRDSSIKNSTINVPTINKRGIEISDTGDATIRGHFMNNMGRGEGTHLYVPDTVLGYKNSHNHSCNYQNLLGNNAFNVAP